MYQFSEEMKAKMPDPVFPCGVEGCGVEVSYDAIDLRWSEEEGKWICQACAEHLGVRRSRFTLEDCQKQVGWVRPTWPE